MAYALMIAVLIFVALVVAASPLLAVIVVIPLLLIYFGLMAAVRRSDRVRGTDETPGEEPAGEKERETGPLPPP